MASTASRPNAAKPFIIRHSSVVILIMSVLVVGSIAIDAVKTPVEEHSELLGGSASYAALAASFFSPVRLVGVVGDDFPNSEFDFLRVLCDSSVL